MWKWPLCLVGLGFCAPASAEEISFAHAMECAQRSVAVAHLNTAAATTSRAASRSTWNEGPLELSVWGGERIAPVAEKGFEWSASVSQQLNYGQANSARKRALAAEAEWMRAESDNLARVRKLDAGLGWATLRSAESRVAYATQDVEAAERIVALTEKLVAAREVTQADLATAKLAVADAKASYLMAEGNRFEARQRLAGVLGSCAKQDLHTGGEVPSIATPKTLSWQQHPQKTARAAEARAEWARARIIESSAQRVRATVDARRDAIGETVVGLSLTIPFLNPSGTRDAARQYAVAAQRQAEQVLHSEVLATEMRIAIHEVEHTEEVYQVVAEEALPAAEVALASREKQLAVGEGTLIELSTSQRQLAATRQTLADAFGNKLRARIRLAIMFGVDP